MPTKLTKRAIAKDFTGINIAIGHCEMQHLLHEYWRNKIGYCAGIYGWDCDFFYNIEDTSMNIVTGYRTDRTGSYELTEQERLSFYELERECYDARYNKPFDKFDEEYQHIRERFKGLLLQVRERVLESN